MCEAMRVKIIIEAGETGDDTEIVDLFRALATMGTVTGVDVEGTPIRGIRVHVPESLLTDEQIAAQVVRIAEDRRAAVDHVAESADDPSPPVEAKSVKPRARKQAPGQADLLGSGFDRMQTLRQIVTSLRDRGMDRARILVSCHQLKAAGGCPVLDVMSSENVEERVVDACESLGIS